MSKTTKIFLGVFGGYLLLTVLAFIVFGSAGKNETFRPQDEFNLDTWINLPGSLDINKAILYLFLAGRPHLLHDGLRRAPDAAAAEPRPDRGRDAVPADARQHHAREHGRQDGDEVVPVHRGPLPVHLVLEPDRVHPAADVAREVLAVRPADPDVRDLRGDGEPVGPARARADRVHLVHDRGHPRQGLHRLLEEPDPRRRDRRDGRLHLRAWSCCRTSCGSSRSPSDSSPTCSPAT